MPDFRRGATAIAKAQEKPEGGGSFRPFAPVLFWKNDGDNKYLLFLNSMEDIPTVDMVSFIPVKGKKGNGDTFTYYEQVIARTDPAIGEAKDPMVEEWDAKPRSTCLAVAVELEPTFEEVRGRKKPVGFEVKTTEFDRRIRDDNGDLTDEVETVEAPVVGFITQSPHNFFNVVSSFDADTAPIHEVATKITRVGNDTSTVYTVAGYDDLDIDLDGLLACIEGVSYLGDDLDDLLDIIDGLDDLEAASAIGAFLLDKRLDELADRDRYDELLEGITESLDRFGSKKKGDKKERTRKERPARRSQRRSKDEDDAPEADPEPDPEPEPEEKPARTRRSRAKKDPEPEPEGEPDPAEEKPKPARRSRAKKADAPAEDTPKQADPASRSKLEELRARAAKRNAAE